MASFANADVFINEFLPNSAETDYEWIEIYNNGTSSVSLSNYNISEESASQNFTIGSVAIAANAFVVLARNGTIFNQTYNLSGITVVEYGPTVPSLNLNDAGDSIFLYNSSGALIDSILSYGGPGENVSIGRHPDGTSNILNLSRQTPGDKNDEAAPVLNKWVNPSSNNSFIRGLVNVTVNITDEAHSVNVSLVNFNNSNFSMSHNANIWYYLWNTSKNSDGNYNISVFFNDTLGFSNIDTLLDVTVDNLNPSIYSPNTTANLRNFVSPGTAFQANVTATDTNLLNVTCTLSGLTVDYSDNSSEWFSCNLTAPSSEGNFEITFTAIDKAGNTNTTTANFTTKYTTAANLTIQDVTVSNLNQSNKIVEVNVTFNNKGSSTIYNPNIILDGFPGNFGQATSDTNKTCSANLSAGQSCSAIFNITVFGGKTSGAYTILWNANWTNNNFTDNRLTEAAASFLTINSNPQITATGNRTATIAHGTNSTLNISINSTGNANLQNVNVAFTPSTLQQSWVAISPSSFSSVGAGINETFNVTVTIPKYTSPGNYSGTLSITADSAEAKSILLIIEVPEDSSWTSYPGTITTFKKTNSAGLLGTIYINNTGNIGHRFDFAASGTLRTYIWNSSNPTSQYVEKGATEAANFYYKAALDFLSNYTSTLTITSFNKSTANTTSLSLTRDDASPFVNITSPLNSSFVKGIIDFNVLSSDLNLSRIEYYANNGLLFNDTGINSTFDWNTSALSDEAYTLKAIAYDSAGNFNTSTINVTINNTDDNPILKANIPSISLAEENSTTLDLSLYFKTIDGDSLRYNFTPVNNITINVNNDTQTANLTAQTDFFGIRYVIFNAIDSSNNITASNNVTITVNNVNDAPSAPALLAPLNNSIVFSAAGNVLLNWSESADADNGILTYYVSYGNDTNLTSSTTTQNTNLVLASLKNATTYYWRVFANDSINISANSSTFQFTVTRDNSPIISSFVPTSLAPSVAENSTLQFNVTASDTDGSLLNFSWYVDNILNKTDGNKFNYTPGFGDAGTHAVAVNVTDNNSNSASNTWTVTVTGTNRAVVLDAIGNYSVAEDSELRFNITANDPDNNTLTFSSNITSISFTKNSNNSLATASWTPTNDNVGNNIVNISVNDGAATDSRLITIIVANANDAPTISSFSPTQNKTIASQSGSQRFEITFADVDAGDTPTASWFRNGTSIAPANSSNVTVAGLNIGTYNITAVVTDNASATARNGWTLTVSDIINSTELTSPVLSLNETERQNATNVTINQSTHGGIDFGNSTLNFSGVVSLEDAFNISNGLISVNTDTYPGLNKSASLSMKSLNFTKAPLIYVAAGFESTAGGVLCPSTICTGINYDSSNGILRFNVAHFTTFFTQENTTNGAPAITSTPGTSASIGSEYRYDVDATDPDGNTLTFSLTTAPSGMSINSGSGLITFTPTSLGNFSVTVNVSDGSLSDSQSYNLLVGEGTMLRITDLDIKVGSKTDKNVQNNSRIKKEAAPGDKISFDLEIKNFFTNEEDLEIEDIDVEITIQDIDDGDDLDESASEFDLRAGKDDNVKIDFEVPLDVDEGSFDVIINVEGRDENGTTHKIRWELELDVEKENHEIRVIRASATPSEIKCQGTVSINTEIINTGAEDEDDVTLEILSQELGISSVTEGIELDSGTEDNRFTKLLTATISNDALPGTYPITINAYYDGKLSDTDTVNLAVQQCEQVKQVKEEVKEEKPKVEVVAPAPKAEEQPEKPIEISFIGSDLYFTLLSIMIVIFIGTAVFIIGAAFIMLRK